jgi:hypothetical protein
MLGLTKKAVGLWKVSGNLLDYQMNKMIVLDTPDKIAFARMATLAKACKLEALGMMGRGGSCCQIARNEFNIKFRSKQKVAEEMQKLVDSALGKV